MGIPEASDVIERSHEADRRTPRRRGHESAAHRVRAWRGGGAGCWLPDPHLPLVEELQVGGRSGTCARIHLGGWPRCSGGTWCPPRVPAIVLRPPGSVPVRSEVLPRSAFAPERAIHDEMVAVPGAVTLMNGLLPTAKW